MTMFTDMCRRDIIRDGSSHLLKFPKDVQRAEELTGGDPNIINDPKFQPEEKIDYRQHFGLKPLKKSLSMKKSVSKRRLSLPVMKSSGSLRIGGLGRSSLTPLLRTSEHRSSLLLKSLPKNTKKYDVKRSTTITKSGLIKMIRIQENSSPAVDRSNANLMKCYLCGVFTSERIEVMIRHGQSHFRGQTLPPPPHVPAQYQHEFNENIRKHKDKPTRLFTSTPKGKSEKSGKRKLVDDSTSTKRKKTDSLTEEKRSNSLNDLSVIGPTKKRRKTKKSKENLNTSESVCEDILKDWDDDDDEELDDSKKEIEEKNAGVSAQGNDSPDSSGIEERRKDAPISTSGKSCFDFDEENDESIMDTTFKFGQKLPRVINEEKRGANKPSSSKEMKTDDDILIGLDKVLEETEVPQIPLIPDLMTDKKKKNHDPPEVSDKIQENDDDIVKDIADETKLTFTGEPNIKPETEIPSTSESVDIENMKNNLNDSVNLDFQNDLDSSNMRNEEIEEGVDFEINEFVTEHTESAPNEKDADLITDVKDLVNEEETTQSETEKLNDGEEPSEVLSKSEEFSQVTELDEVKSESNESTLYEKHDLTVDVSNLVESSSSEFDLTPAEYEEKSEEKVPELGKTLVEDGCDVKRRPIADFQEDTSSSDSEEMFTLKQIEDDSNFENIIGFEQPEELSLESQDKGKQPEELSLEVKKKNDIDSVQKSDILTNEKNEEVLKITEENTMHPFDYEYNDLSKDDETKNFTNNYAESEEAVVLGNEKFDSKAKSSDNLKGEVSLESKENIVSAEEQTDDNQHELVDKMDFMESNEFSTEHWMEEEVIKKHADVDKATNYEETEGFEDVSQQVVQSEILEPKVKSEMIASTNDEITFDLKIPETKSLFEEENTNASEETSPAPSDKVSPAPAKDNLTMDLFTDKDILQSVDLKVPPELLPERKTKIFETSDSGSDFEMDDTVMKPLNIDNIKKSEPSLDEKKEDQLRRSKRFTRKRVDFVKLYPKKQKSVETTPEMLGENIELEKSADNNANLEIQIQNLDINNMPIVYGNDENTISGIGSDIKEVRDHFGPPPQGARIVDVRFLNQFDPEDLSPNKVLFTMPSKEEFEEIEKRRAAAAAVTKTTKIVPKPATPSFAIPSAPLSQSNILIRKDAPRTAVGGKMQLVSRTNQGTKLLLISPGGGNKTVIPAQQISTVSGNSLSTAKIPTGIKLPVSKLPPGTRFITTGSVQKLASGNKLITGRMNIPTSSKVVRATLQNTKVIKQSGGRNIVAGLRSPDVSHIRKVDLVQPSTSGISVKVESKSNVPQSRQLIFQKDSKKPMTGKQSQPNILQKNQKRIYRPPVSTSKPVVTNPPPNSALTELSHSEVLLQDVKTDQNETIEISFVNVGDGTGQMNPIIETGTEGVLIEDAQNSTEMEKIIILDGTENFTNSSFQQTLITKPTQDILAKALADTQVFQTESPDLEETVLLEQQYANPPSLSHNVLETSLTLNQPPIMTPLELPSSVTQQTVLRHNRRKVEVQPSMPLLTDEGDLQSAPIFINTANLSTSSTPMSFQFINDNNIVVASSSGTTVPSLDQRIIFSPELISDQLKKNSAEYQYLNSGTLVESKEENVLPEFFKGNIGKRSKPDSKKKKT